jgi:predicted phage terminase large subunit-like protein
MDDRELHILLRADLALFIGRVFLHLFPDTEYLPNWHIDLIAGRLEAVLDGRINRLIINVPPRSLKSVIASVAFPAFCLGHRPSMQLICASYGQDLADKFAVDCRGVMQSAWYQRLFGVRLTGRRPAVADFSTTAGGGRFATSVGGVLTGRGGDIIVIDDPLKPSEALSEAERQAANHWFDHTLMTRLNDKRTGAIVIIMQRLHEDDLVGHVLAKGGWDVLSLPAIAEVEERFVIPSLLGEQKIVRRPGEALHASREPLEVLEELKRNLGEYHFASQYQQSPVPLGGAMIRQAWIRYYAPPELPATFDLVVQSWDTASKDHQFADFSAGVTLGVRSGVVYVLDVVRRRMDFPTLRAAVEEAYRQYRPHVILVEDASSGIQLVQELKAANIYAVTPIRPDRDKETRLFAQSILFQSGRVRLPERAVWLSDFVSELTSFPAAKFDDQVDAISQALTYLRERLDEPGLITYYRELANQYRNALQ